MASVDLKSGTDWSRITSRSLDAGGCQDRVDSTAGRLPGRKAAVRMDGGRQVRQVPAQQGDHADAGQDRTDRAAKPMRRSGSERPQRAPPPRVRPA